VWGAFIKISRGIYFLELYFFLTSDCNMKTIQKLLKRKRRDLESKSFTAFSLPELLVVLVIIGILVLIALPNPLVFMIRSGYEEWVS